MMKHIKLTLFLMCVLLITYSCDTDTCLHGKGDRVIREVPTAFFDRVEVHGIMHVVLVEDSLDKLEFEGGEHELDYLTAEVRDSCLYLYNTNTCYFLRGYDRAIAYIHYSRLEHVFLKETSRLTSEGTLRRLQSVQLHGEMAEIDLELDVDHFKFYNHTTTGGDFIFRGKANSCSFGNYYTARCDISQLYVRSMNLINGSLSDLYVNAEERLQVRIQHRGNVYYSGSPEIVIDSISGGGALLPWDGVAPN